METKLNNGVVTNSLSRYLGISPSRLIGLGVFDLALPYDNNFFVDVFLMKDSNIPEFSESYDKFLKHFGLLSTYLKSSQVKGDKSWKAAERMLHFKEESGFHLGYSKTLGKGSGVGPKFSRQLLQSAKEILDLDIQDPEAYFFIPFIEGGIGCDRISDMACHILGEEFGQYTERILDELKITKRKVFHVGGKNFNLVPMPSNPSKPLLMVPKSFLRRLPAQFSWTDIFDFYSLNQRYRDKVNSQLSKIIGAKNAANKDKVKKSHIKTILLEERSLFKAVVKDFIDQYPADIEMRNLAKVLCQENPLDLGFKEGAECSLAVVQKICDQFQFLIEKKGAWASLYKDGYPLNESYAQTLFHAVALSYCEANKIDVLPEVQTGRGRVDFRINDGDEKVIVEMKLSTHGRLMHGYSTQIQEYISADRSDHCIFLIVKVFEFAEARKLETAEAVKEIMRLRQKMDSRIMQVQKQHEKDQPSNISLNIVDGSFKESASVML